MKVGIDPGVTGAIVLLDDQLQAIFVCDMPVMALGQNKQQVNAVSVFTILEGWRRKHEGNMDVYLEQVGAMPGQGVTSMFNFGVSYGVIMGVVGAMQLPLFLIRPNAWKKTAGLIGKPKEAARTLAIQLYPGVDLAHKKDVGRADALLIARFGFLTHA